ncbi:hypothetical protein IV102_07985 [bacterium]|nr:hypothetical protein [bacterium]
MMTVARQYSVTTTVIHRVASLDDGGPRQASFMFQEEAQQLKFDGQLEDCVVGNVSSQGREGLFTSLSQLESLWQDGTFDKTRQRLESEEAIKVDLGTDRKWTATKGDHDTVEFHNGVSKLEVFPGNQVRLTVRTDLAKLTQEISGSWNEKTGTITVESEQIQVTEGQV